MGQGITHHRFGPDDLDRLLAVPPDLFDHPFRPDQAAAFLGDHAHELILAYDGDLAVGMVSGTVILHPDQPPSMFINEVGVRESHQRRGIANRLIDAMVGLARDRGCEGVWLGTEADNAPTLALYRSMGAQELRGSYFGWDDAFG